MKEGSLPNATATKHWRDFSFHLSLQKLFLVFIYFFSDLSV